MMGVGMSGALEPLEGGSGTSCLAVAFVNTSEVLSAFDPFGRATMGGRVVKSRIMRWSESPLIVPDALRSRLRSWDVPRSDDEGLESDRAAGDVRGSWAEDEEGIGDFVQDLFEASSLPSSSDSESHSGSLQPFC